jgi:hypothetical protein
MGFHYSETRLRSAHSYGIIEATLEPVGQVADEDFDHEEFPQGDEPAAWRPPVQCPRCQQSQTRFITLNYEISVYECELCGEQFEVDETL